jgi:hypothetical protein
MTKFTASYEPPPPNRFRNGDWWRTRTGMLCRVCRGNLGLPGYAALVPANGQPAGHFPATQVAGFTRQSWGGNP